MNKHKLSSGQLVQWTNQYKQQMIWMVCDDTTKGVIIHSDGLLSIGTITELTNLPITSFIGNVNIASTK
jgi:hypothetical protein